MATEAASTAATTTSTLPRPSRGAGTSSSRFNSPRGPRRGGGGGNRGASNAALSKSNRAEGSDWASQEEQAEDTSEEVAQLKIKYANDLKVLRDIFPEWTVEDLVFTLQECNGDSSMATDRITRG